MLSSSDFAWFRTVFHYSQVHDCIERDESDCPFCSIIRANSLLPRRRWFPSFRNAKEAHVPKNALASDWTGVDSLPRTENRSCLDHDLSLITDGIPPGDHGDDRSPCFAHAILASSPTALFRHRLLRSSFIYSAAHGATSSTPTSLHRREHRTIIGSCWRPTIRYANSSSLTVVSINILGLGCCA